MRAGWSPELEDLVRRPDSKARILAELVANAREDVRRRLDQWATLDGATYFPPDPENPDTPRGTLTGFEVLKDGGIRLAGTLTPVAENTTVLSGLIQDLDDVAPLENVAWIRWGGAEPDLMEIHRIEVQVFQEHDPGGSGITRPDRWALQMLHVAEARRTDTDRVELVTMPLCETLYSSSAVTGVGEVLVFAPPGVKPTPKAYGPALRRDPEDELTVYHLYPVTLFILIPLTAEGAYSPGHTWFSRTDVPLVNDGGNIIARVTLTASEGDPSGQYRIIENDPPLEVPYISVQSRTYVEATATFSTEPLDLGAVPTLDVEAVMNAELPPGTAVTAEIAEPGGAFHEFADGDLVDVDNAEQGGHDLTAVAKRQDYEQRVTLTPDATGFLTPTVRALGVRELERTLLSAEIAVTGEPQWAVDPKSLKGEITEAVLSIVKDGPMDGLDIGSDLLAKYHVKQLEARFYIGHPDLARSKWLHVDTFLIDDQAGRGGRHDFTLLSHLATLRRVIPPQEEASPGVWVRQPLVYVDQAIATVDEDLVAQLGVPDRVRGPGAELATGSVLPNEAIGKRVTRADGKSELDAVRYIAGGGTISSQGRIRFVDLFGKKAVAHVFPKEEISVPDASPGIRARVPEFFVPFGWRDDLSEFQGEARGFNLNAIEKIGDLSLDQPGVLEEEIARWIPRDGITEPPTSALGAKVATRKVEAQGAGVILIPFRTAYAYPEVEPGDMVAIEVEHFAAKDPVRDREIRGPLWVLGVIIAGRGVWQRDFVLWVRSYADLLPASEEIKRERFGYATLDNFRETSRTVDDVTYGGEYGFDCAEVWVYDSLLTQPVAGDPWPDDATLPDSVLVEGVDALSYTAAAPAEGQVRYLQFEARDGAGRLGEVRRVIVFASAWQPPVVEYDDTETPTGAPDTGVLWWRIQERGNPVTLVRVWKQTGRQAGEWVTPDRDQGDASTVRGGTLGAGEYEADLPLDPEHLSWMQVEITLTTGEVMVSEPFGFDRDTAPTIISAIVREQKVDLIVDTDTKSVKLERTDAAGWFQHVDVAGSHVFDVALADGNLNAGIGGADTWNMRATGYADPVAEVDGSTPSTSRDLVVKGSSAGAAPVWELVHATAPAIGDDDLSLELDADTSAGHTVKVFESHDDGGGFTAFADVTAGFSPAPGAPPTSPTTYTLDTPYTRVAKSSFDQPKVTYKLRAEIRNGSNVVVASIERVVSWYLQPS